MFHCFNSLLVARRTDKRNDTFGSRLREVPILATTATYTCAHAVIYLPRGNALRRGGSETRLERTAEIKPIGSAPPRKGGPTHFSQKKYQNFSPHEKTYLLLIRGIFVIVVVVVLCLSSSVS